MNEVTVFIRSMRFLGTQIVSYPMLWQIRQFWPGCRLRVVAQDDVGRHYLSLPWVDEFIQADTFTENYRALGRRTDMMIVLHFASDKYGAVAMLRDAIRRSTEEGLLKSPARAHIRFTRSAFFCPFKMINRHDC